MDASVSLFDRGSETGERAAVVVRRQLRVTQSLERVGRSFGGARWAFGIGSVFHGDKIFFSPICQKSNFC